MSSAYYRLILSESGLLAYYRMSGPVGVAVAYDESPNAYHGRIEGNTPDISFLQQGPIIADPTDFAMKFNGVTPYIALPSGLTTNARAAFSVECWLFLTTNTYINYQTLVGNDHSNSSHVGFYLDLAPTSDGAAAYFQVGNGSVSNFASVGGAPFATGGWIYLCGVFNGSSVVLYSISADKGYTQTSNALAGTIGTTAFPIWIAANPNQASVLYSNTLDEVALYSTALTTSQVLNHYQTGISGRSGVTPFPSVARRQS